MARFKPPGDCPNCDAPVPAHARSCPGCGASAEAGWDEADGSEGLNLPGDDDFDYDAYLEKEFGSGEPKRRSRFPWLWPSVALVLAVAFLWFAFAHWL